MAWKGIIGKSLTAPEFAEYVSKLNWTTWKPEFIVVHNTAAPSLSQRPEGLTAQHIKNLEGYYRDKQGWSSGPHLFIDDRQIWLFTSLLTPGTHSPSWNSRSIGIEMLGDFNKESFNQGRGYKVREHTVWAVAQLSKRLGFKPDAWRFHNQDPKTTHDCPGINARNVRADLVREVSRDMEVTTRPPLPATEAWGVILDDGLKRK